MMSDVVSLCLAQNLTHYTERSFGLGPLALLVQCQKNVQSVNKLHSCSLQKLLSETFNTLFKLN